VAAIRALPADAPAPASRSLASRSVPVGVRHALRVCMSRQCAEL
jgi:hypothetical protein